MFVLLSLAAILLQTGSRINASGDSGDDDGDEIQLRYRIEEEIPRGTLIGNIVDDARLRTRYHTAALSLIRFRFLGASEGTQGGLGLFEVGLTSGIIRTTGDIDRDSSALCRQKRHCAVNIDVVIQPVQYFRIIKVCFLVLRPWAK